MNYQGKCEVIMPDIIVKERQQNANVTVVLDPPRKGCDTKVINSLLENKVDKIVYVSCKPSTLARDVGLLVGSLEVVNGEVKKAVDYKPNYEITLVRPFDMFANTKHVETWVCLTRK